MASAGMRMLRPILIPPTSKHTASVLFLHGSGDTGEGVCVWMREILQQHLSFPHIRMIYPTAPARPYTPMNGMPSTVWFDRDQISPLGKEDVASVDEMSSYLEDIISAEVKNGIPHERIIIGGFSMGGSMAMYYGFGYGTSLAGIFALSSFLNNNSFAYRAIQSHPGKMPKTFLAHGHRDPLVNIEWGVKTYETLKKLNVDCSFETYHDLFHQMNLKEINCLKKWIKERLPDV